MGDEDAFLRAIAQAPYDDAPRLAYADWLDEHGHPDRAEYLRLTCRTDVLGAVDRLREVGPRLDPAWLAGLNAGFPVVHPRYRVLRVVAHGVRTTVYEAVHSHPDPSDRRLALSVLNDPRYGDHFLAVCRVCAHLAHAHILPMYAVEEFNGVYYAVRRLIDGSLHDHIRRRDLDAAAVVRLVSAVAAAVDALHGCVVMHGYVHPRHVLVDGDGTPWLIGLGEDPAANSDGNPLHLAPEQMTPPPWRAGPACDVYQLAETAAWLLTGMHPFQSYHGFLDLLAAKRQPDAWRIGPLRDLSGPLTRVFRRALCPDPDRRHPTPGEFAAAFANALQRPARSWWQIW